MRKEGEVERPYIMEIYEHGSHVKFLCQQVLKHGGDKTETVQLTQTYVADTSVVHRIFRWLGLGIRQGDLELAPPESCV